MLPTAVRPASHPPHQFDFVYLASQSPRRAQLLDQLGVVHKPLLPGREEDAEALEASRSNEAARDYVQRVALLKLAAARARLRKRRLAEAPILVADTTVVIGRRILGKPADADEACAMLEALSGRTHRVLTAVVVSEGVRAHLATCESRVRFASLSRQSITRYVAGGHAQGKAGAYAIQSRIAAWVERIEGSYSGVMGLPLFETARLLARARVRLDV